LTGGCPLRPPFSLDQNRIVHTRNNSLLKYPIGKIGGRLRGIDALRGAAALGVVLYHEVGSKPLPRVGPVATWFTTPLWAGSSFGYAGVFLFFVISGFCIHLQWSSRRLTEQNPRLDFKAFWKRRVKRLYPPYLFALTIFLVVAGVTTPFRVSAMYLWDLLLHLLMLHNLDVRTTYSINGVFWTLAIEEQLYLLYFVLLFLRNRFGWRRTLMVCAATRVGWLLLALSAQRWFGIQIPVPEAALSHWFTWALGAIAVEAALGIVTLPRWCSRTSIGVLALLSAVSATQLLPLLQPIKALHDSAWLLLHPLWGVAFFIIVNRLVAAEKKWRESQRIPAFIRAFAAVGLISYSLYLTHELVLMEAYRFEAIGLSPTFVAVVIMTPATLLFAWLFFTFCERPYLRSPRIRRNAPYVSAPAMSAYLSGPIAVPAPALSAEPAPK